jgi:hypothetical protein
MMQGYVALRIDICFFFTIMTSISPCPIRLDLFGDLELPRHLNYLLWLTAGFPTSLHLSFGAATVPARTEEKYVDDCESLVSSLELFFFFDGLSAPLKFRFPSIRPISNGEPPRSHTTISEVTILFQCIAP